MNVRGVSLGTSSLSRLLLLVIARSVDDDAFYDTMCDISLCTSILQHYLRKTVSRARI